MDQEQKVIIYTDGGCKPNPGAGGWAALLIYGDTQKPLYGYDMQTTNNRMELTAAVRALAALTRPCAVEFHTDSQYMRNGITSWIGKWRQNGWRTANKKPVENQDLWMQLYDMTQQHTIDWKWVRGHAGNQYNERVDQLATRAREQRISSEA
ncbi:MAG: ribonuclease HI [Anaerolineae bacterium]|nr:ribonuclease HI [Anaerolineae bacterium]MCA9907286.1 ribonuclease HI [Anaerolineae bacterium]